VGHNLATRFVHQPTIFLCVLVNKLARSEYIHIALDLPAKSQVLTPRCLDQPRHCIIHLICVWVGTLVTEINALLGIATDMGDVAFDIVRDVQVL